MFNKYLKLLFAACLCSVYMLFSMAIRHLYIEKTKQFSLTFKLLV